MFWEAIDTNGEYLGIDSNVFKALFVSWFFLGFGNAGGVRIVLAQSAQKPPGRQKDYCSLELRAKVERLKAEVTEDFTDEDNAEARISVLWEWANARGAGRLSHTARSTARRQFQGMANLARISGGQIGRFGIGDIELLQSPCQSYRSRFEKRQPGQFLHSNTG